MFNFAFGGDGGDPFGGGGGFHSAFGGQPGRQREVDNNKFYDLLGVSKTADDNEIKKAYRKLALTHHPDRGGDAETFKEIGRAYEVLSNSEKRSIYDQAGEEGLENGGAGGGGGGAMDIFDLFNGGGGFARQQRGPRKGEDVVFPLKVTLEELYTGCTKKLRLTKNIICTTCNGKGGKSETTCRGCKGQGIKLIVRQIGPGMIQQMQSTCSDCSGTGRQIADKDKCKKCYGEKTTKEKKTLEVHITQGFSHNQKITFNGEADEMPNTVPGDVVVVLQQIEHSVFRRDGTNLFVKKDISLFEALCGFNFVLKHLDGHTLVVRSLPTDVTKPGSVRVIRQHGMPNLKTYQRGDLYVEFNVVFPDSNLLTDEQRVMLRNALPQGDVDMELESAEVLVQQKDEHCDEVYLQDFDASDARKHAQSNQQTEYDEEEEEGHHHGGRQQQCRQA